MLAFSLILTLLVGVPLAGGTVLSAAAVSWSGDFSNFSAASPRSGIAPRTDALEREVVVSQRDAEAPPRPDTLERAVVVSQRDAEAPPRTDALEREVVVSQRDAEAPPRTDALEREVVISQRDAEAPPRTDALEREVVISQRDAEAPPRPDTLERAVVVSQRDAEASHSAPLQTLGRKAIERSGAAGLHEILRSFAGVSVRDYGGIGGIKTVSVRNLGAQHTAVSYDGITVSDAQNGQIDISRFALENVSELSVEIGAADDIFRSARLLNSAGLLSISTSRPVFGGRPYAVSASMRYGSFSTYNPSLTYSRKIGRRWSITTSADWLKSDGVYPFTLINGSLRTKERRLNSDVNTLGAEINLYGGIGAGQFQMKARGYLSERGLPGSVIYYSQNPTERLWDKDLSLSSIYTAPLGSRSRIRQTFSLSRAYNRYTNSSALYRVPEDDRYTQYEAASSTIFEYRSTGRLRFTLAEDLFLNHLESSIPESRTPSRISSVSALSGQYRSPRLTLTGSLSATAVHEWTESGSPAPDRGRLSPSLSASWRTSESLRLRASWRDGFRIPTFNDLYYARVGNTALLPEKASQFNLGATLSLRPAANPSSGEAARNRARLTLTSDLYYNSVRDKIVAIPTMFIWKMRNLGKVQMFGGDFTAAYSRELWGVLALGLRANYSYRYAVDITDPQAKNYRHQIQYTPRHSGNVLLTLGLPWFDFSYTLNAVGKRYFLQQNIPANEMAAYCDHSLSISREFAPGRDTRGGGKGDAAAGLAARGGGKSAGGVSGLRLRLSAEVLNLGGSNYEIIKYYPMPGRNFRVKLKISF